MSLKLNQPNKILSFKNYKLDFSGATRIMGVLNVTPDSFSDGGRFFNKAEAVKRGVQMAGEGATIIDIGGESTRPGSEPVGADEELGRVIPVIQKLAPEINIPVSIDTSKPEVAREAVHAGASIINDVMGTPLDRRMASVAAEFDVPIVIMHIKGAPRTMQENPFYTDVVGEIMRALQASISVAEDCGCDPSKIIVDPGIGFGKTAAHNIEIIKRLGELKALRRTILIGPSRKSFIGAALGIDDPGGRIMGTAAAVAASVINGADIVRVHDVKEIAQLCGMLDRVFKT